jgi:hypothetical protein
VSTTTTLLLIAATLFLLAELTLVGAIWAPAALRRRRASAEVRDRARRPRAG